MWATTLLALTWSMGSGGAQTNLVLDGGFEFPPGTLGYRTGRMGAWSVKTSSDQVGIYETDFFPGSNITEGNQAFDLGMGGNAQGNSISQVLPTIAGQTYRLTFDWGSEYAQGTSAFVSVGNLNEELSEPQRTPESYPYDTTPWIVNSASFQFVASGNDTLKFGEVATRFDWWGLVLDNISVVSVSPPLMLTVSGSNVILTWPGEATGFTLESTTNLTAPVTWTSVSLAPEVVNGQNSVTVPISGERQFFRLKQ